MVIALLWQWEACSSLLADGPEKNRAASLLGADAAGLAAGAAACPLLGTERATCLHLGSPQAWPAQRQGDSVVTSMIGQLFF